MCQTFLNIFRLKLFWNDLQNLSIEKATSLVPLISLIGFQLLLRAPLPNPFRGFGSSGVSAWSTDSLFKLILTKRHYFVQKLSEERYKTLFN